MADHASRRPNGDLNKHSQVPLDSCEAAMQPCPTVQNFTPLETHIRGVGRTLAVLQALNIKNGSTVTQIQRRNGLSRPSIYRILDGLIEAGFVSPGRIPHIYVLTSKVRSLSQGYTNDNLIAEIAAPILDQLQKKVTWPTELATLQDFRMHLRDATRHQSPMVIDGEVVGKSVPLLSSALGLAYLSRCAPARRQSILANLRAISSDRGRFPGGQRVRLMLEAIRARGYAWREGGVIEGRKYQTSTIAIPIFANGDVRAALGLTFFLSALSVEEAAARYISDLRRAGQIIEKQIGKMGFG